MAQRSVHDPSSPLGAPSVWASIGGRVDGALLGVGLAIVFFLPSHLEGDGLSRFQVVDAIAHGQSVAGARYPVWGALGSLPLYGVGRLVGHPRMLTAHYNGVLLAVGVYVLSIVLRGLLPPRPLRFFLLLVVGGSMFAAHAEEFYGEVFTALLLGTGIVLVVRRPRWTSWVPVVIGVANTPAAAPALAVLVGWRIVREGRLRWALALGCAAALIVIDAAARHRSLLFGSYAGDRGEVTILPYSGRPGFSYPLVLGVAAILFSFGKGLCFFVPALFVSVSAGVRRRLPAEVADVQIGWVLFTATLVVTYGAWWAWDGGFFWGPRFFLIGCLPASLALAAFLDAPPTRSWAKVAVMGLLAATVYVAVNGATLQSRSTFLYCQAHAVSIPFLCSDTAEFSPLWRPFLDVLHPTIAQWTFTGWAIIVGARLTIPTISRIRSDLVINQPHILAVRGQRRWIW